VKRKHRRQRGDDYGLPPQGAAPAPAAVPDTAQRAAQAKRWRLVVIALAVLLAVGVGAGIFFATAMRPGNPIVVIDTSFGSIRVELYRREAPITVDNFLKYTDDKFYDGTIFHRVIPKFMIQGGGFLPGLRPKYEARDSIKNESYNGLKNQRGTIAMARTNDPDSARAQFFINVADNDFLNPGPRNAGYAVFGKVIEGMDVVDRIAAVRTSSRPDVIEPRAKHDDVPVEDVIIQSIRRE
jgi:cyclophilin family peptidyl-prolyl cis-trans isomerase